MIGKGLKVKLLDFGCSKIMKPGKLMHEVLGTIFYMAPEIYL